METPFANVRAALNESREKSDVDTLANLANNYAEVRITVRVPGSLIEADGPQIFGYSQLIPAYQVRMPIRRALPFTLEKAARDIEVSMRFR